MIKDIRIYYNEELERVYFKARHYESTYEEKSIIPYFGNCCIKDILFSVNAIGEIIDNQGTMILLPRNIQDNILVLLKYILTSRIDFKELKEKAKKKREYIEDLIEHETDMI